MNPEKSLQNKLNWGNLGKGLCAKCSDVLSTPVAGKLVTCNNIYCTFTISYGKYMDLAKGKQSSYYKEAVKVKKNIKNYNKKKNASYQRAIQAQAAERASNLRRARAKALT